MALNIFRYSNLIFPSRYMLPVGTLNTGYSNLSSVFTLPIYTMPMLPIQSSFSFLPFNFMPKIPNIWDSFCSKFGNGLKTLKQTFNTVTEKVGNIIKGEARYQAHYTAISDRVRAYGENSKYIEKLHPAMQEKMMQLLDWAKSKGISLKITSGFRSAAQQNALQYKNKGGKKIAAATGSSPHEYGIAVDFRSSNNTAVGQKAKELGMRWGGDWGGRGHWAKEEWHVDMANTLKKVKA